jgi:hypothetical protein
LEEIVEAVFFGKPSQPGYVPYHGQASGLRFPQSSMHVRVEGTQLAQQL